MIGQRGGERGVAAGEPQVVTLSRNDKRQPVLATAGESEGDGTRTRNHWIDSPP